MSDLTVITGGAGSIGSEIVRRLVREDVRVRVADIDEEAIWALRAEVPEAEYLPADCLHDARRIVDGADCVIHCAALKHIDLCEANPALARRVNVLATVALLQALPSSVPFVFISTDKAIRPIWVMGHTKRIAEAEVLAVRGNVVTFGNVLGTRGSLVPAVKRWGALGKPIPLTDPRMTRWMMRVDEAVDLVLAASDAPRAGTRFVPREPRAVNIGEFIHICRDRLAPGSLIVRTGARPGERLHEPMRLVDGGIVWSDDLDYAMGREEMCVLIDGVVDRLEVVA